MLTSRQSHKGSPNKWGLLRSCLVGSETCQGRVPQGHESDPVMGHLMLQGSLCCNRWQHHHEGGPNKWGLLRSCLRGSETSQGHDPQSHECSPNNWGLLMIQGSPCCNRWHHNHKRGPNKWGLLRSCLGGFETSQGRESHVSRSPQPKADYGRS